MLCLILIILDTNETKYVCVSNYLFITYTCGASSIIRIVFNTSVLLQCYRALETLILIKMETSRWAEVELKFLLVREMYWGSPWSYINHIARLKQLTIQETHVQIPALTQILIQCFTLFSLF